MKEKQTKDKNNIPQKKKPYQKPEIISERTFETAALACSKCDAFGPDFYDPGCGAAEGTS